MSSVKSTTLAYYSPNLKKKQVPKPITELIKLSASSVIGWGPFKIYFEILKMPQPITELALSFISSVIGLGTWFFLRFGE